MYHFQFLMLDNLLLLTFPRNLNFYISNNILQCLHFYTEQTIVPAVGGYWGALPLLTLLSICIVRAIFHLIPLPALLSISVGVGCEWTGEDWHRSGLNISSSPPQSPLSLRPGASPCSQCVDTDSWHLATCYNTSPSCLWINCMNISLKVILDFCVRIEKRKEMPVFILYNKK